MKRLVILVLLAAATLAAADLACSSAKGGLVNDRLADCPRSPNCACSEDPRPTHRVEPLDLGADPEAGWGRLVEVVAGFERTHVDTRGEDYLHAVVTSRLFRFRDDLELRFDRRLGVAHVRSASRMGFSDLGVNRSRVDELRRRLAAALAPSTQAASSR